MKPVLKILGVLWTSPNTLFGLLVGLVAFPFGCKGKWVEGAIEIHGRLIRRMLGWLPNNIRAITLGHAILGVDERSLEIAREHEHVHIRQYELWGPFFITAYLLSSAYLKLVGKDPYYDNPFEKQAYAISSPDFGSSLDFGPSSDADTAVPENDFDEKNDAEQGNRN